MSSLWHSLALILLGHPPNALLVQYNFLPPLVRIWMTPSPSAVLRIIQPTAPQSIVHV